MSLNPLQLLIKTRLAAMAYFTTPTVVPIFTEDSGDLENKILTKLGTLGCGVAVTVLIPSGRHCDPRKGAPTNLLLEAEITVSENSIINRDATGAQKPAYSAIREIIKHASEGGLQGWWPGAPFSRMEFIEFQADSGTVKGQNLIIYSAKFEVKELL